MNAPPLAWTDTGGSAYVQRDAQQKLTTIGLLIPASTVKGVPANRSEAVYPLDGAGLVKTANLQWHPSGHEPAHVYDLPHFDVHFYVIPESVRKAIVPGAPAGGVLPPKTMLPDDGILAPGFVPGMGMHLVQKTQPEFNGGKFGVSPILGFWDGDVAFFEVMFTKEWIQQNIDKTGTMPQPGFVKQHGMYPTAYAVHYDKAKDGYRVELTDFRER